MGHTLHALYLLEPDDEKASPTAPARHGYYFESGTGLWFEPGKSATDPSPAEQIFKVSYTIYGSPLLRRIIPGGTLILQNQPG